MLTAGTKENVNAVEMPSHPCFKSIVTTLKTSFHLIESIKCQIWFGCVNHATAWFTTVQYRLNLNAKTVGKIMKYREKLKL